MLPIISPANDDFANRIPLLGSQVITNGTSLDATLETGEPALQGFPGGSSVWWSWTAPHGGLIQATVTSSGFSPLIGVYTGSSLTGLALVGSGIPDTNGVASTADFAATPGAVYQISVDASGGQGGPFQLAIAFRAPSLGGSGFDSGGQFQFSFNVPPNTAYAIDTSINLVDWSLVTTGTSGPDGTVTYVEPPAQAGLMRFYRVRSL
jgi:hypothetical protein